MRRTASCVAYISHPEFDSSSTAKRFNRERLGRDNVTTLGSHLLTRRATPRSMTCQRCIGRAIAAPEAKHRAGDDRHRTCQSGRKLRCCEQDGACQRGRNRTRHHRRAAVLRPAEEARRRLSAAQRQRPEQSGLAAGLHGVARRTCAGHADQPVGHRRCPDLAGSGGGGSGCWGWGWGILKWADCFWRSRGCSDKTVIAA